MLPPRIRTNTLAGFVELARCLQLDPAALMAGVGLDVADREATVRAAHRLGIVHIPRPRRPVS